MEMAIDAQWSSLSRRAFSIVRKNFSSTLYEVTENDGSFTYKYDRCGHHDMAKHLRITSSLQRARRCPKQALSAIR